MMNGILRIQTYRPRQSAPVEGVTVVITGSGFTAHRITDAEGNADGDDNQRAHAFTTLSGWTCAA